MSILVLLHRDMFIASLKTSRQIPSTEMNCLDSLQKCHSQVLEGWLISYLLLGLRVEFEMKDASLVSTCIEKH